MPAGPQERGRLKLNKPLDEPLNEPPDREPASSWWALIGLSQAAVLMIALIMPVTPSKTGSEWSLAELFTENPSYLQEVGVYFVATEILALVLGGVFWFLATRSRQP